MLLIVFASAATASRSTKRGCVLRSVSEVNLVAKGSAPRGMNIFPPLPSSAANRAISWSLSQVTKGRA
jgi:hypothetical protein